MYENGPCIGCGRSEPEVKLHVDHVDARTKDPDLLESSGRKRSIWDWPNERRNAELAKCVVRCEECHTEKTYVNFERAAGERHGRAYASDALVAEILERKRAGETYKNLSAEYGIPWTRIQKWNLGIARSRPDIRS